MLCEKQFALFQAYHLILLNAYVFINKAKIGTHIFIFLLMSNDCSNIGILGFGQLYTGFNPLVWPLTQYIC